MARILLTDTGKCTGCRLCETVCSVTKTGKVNPRQSRIRIVRLDRTDKPYIPVVHGQGFASSYTAHAKPDLTSILEGFTVLAPCDCCKGNPECVKSCESGALRYEEPLNDSSTGSAGGSG